VGECAVLLVVPVGADGAVHAAAAVLLGLLGRAQVLDYGAVGNELEGGLLCRLALALALLGRLLDERLEDGLLRGVLVSRCSGDEDWCEVEVEVEVEAERKGVAPGVAYNDGRVPFSDLAVVVQLSAADGSLAGLGSSAIASVLAVFVVVAYAAGNALQLVCWER
jgi:hypothetical protein